MQDEWAAGGLLVSPGWLAHRLGCPAGPLVALWAQGPAYLPACSVVSWECWRGRSLVSPSSLNNQTEASGMRNWEYEPQKGKISKIRLFFTQSSSLFWLPCFRIWNTCLFYSLKLPISEWPPAPHFFPHSPHGSDPKPMVFLSSVSLEYPLFFTPMTTTIH